MPKIDEESIFNSISDEEADRGIPFCVMTTEEIIKLIDEWDKEHPVYCNSIYERMRLEDEAIGKAYLVPYRSPEEELESMCGQYRDALKARGL